MLPDASDAIRCGPVWLSPEQMCELRIGDHAVPLSALRLRMLGELINANGRWLSPRDLAGDTRSVASIDVHIFWIRRALGPYGKFLVNVRGRGYRMDVVALSQE